MALLSTIALALQALRVFLNEDSLQKENMGLQMWFINMQNWLNQQKDGPSAPQLKLKFKKLTDIIVYATGCRSGFAFEKVPKCWRRPKRKPCKGILQIRIEKNESIYWHCPKCNDEGRINGWQGLIWDIRKGTIH